MYLFYQLVMFQSLADLISQQEFIQYFDYVLRGRYFRNIYEIDSQSCISADHVRILT